MNQNLINFTVTFFTGDTETSDEVSQLIIENLPMVDSYDYSVSIKNSDDNKYQSCMGQLEVIIPKDFLFDSMVAIDHVKSGIPSDIIPSRCSDITLVIDMDKEKSEVHSSVLHYLINHSQEKQKTIEYQGDMIKELDSSLIVLEKKIERLESRYAEFYTYIHQFIDLPRMSLLVDDLVDIVDENLKDKYGSKVTVQ